MAKWITWAGDSLTPPSDAKTHDGSGAYPPPVTYACYEDVPIPVRAAMKQGYESGITVEQLHILFDFPVDWIERMVLTPH